MPVKVFSCLVEGLSGHLVEVEADIMSGLSAFTIVGLGDTSVQESKERIRSAIKNTRANYPQQKKIINLAPASLRKQGPSFDLPIAVALLSASKQLPTVATQNALFIGELALNGQIRPVNNALSIALFAKENSWPSIYLPTENYAEASLIKGPDIIPVHSLQQLIQILTGEISSPEKPLVTSSNQNGNQSEQNAEHSAFDLIEGQEEAKRAIQISAAGGHHLLLHGPPGIGKTILAKSLSELLPSLTEEEILETTRIYSAAARLHPYQPLITTRPFREIHHTATLTSLTGGGLPLKPGEISLAHNGILFMDEFPEFPRSHIEVLRQPLEQRCIHLSRQHSQVTFPARFTLVAAMNPCHCGNYGDPDKPCICTPTAIQNYRKKISGPILDRLDLTVKLARPKFTGKNKKSTFHQLKIAIAKARQIQQKRFQNTSFKTNTELTNRSIKNFLQLDVSAEKYLQQLRDKNLLSARGFEQLLKMALTIADLKEQNQITHLELAEAWHFKATQY